MGNFVAISLDSNSTRWLNQNKISQLTYMLDSVTTNYIYDYFSLRLYSIVLVL